MSWAHGGLCACSWVPASLSQLASPQGAPVPAATAECSGVELQISMHEFPQADVDAAASAHLGVQGALEHATPAMQRTLQGGVLNLRILRVGGRAGGWVGGWVRCGAGQLLRAGCARSTSTLLLDIMSALDLHRQWLSLHLMLPWHVQVESLTGKSWLVGGWKRSVQVGRQHVHCAGRWLSAPGRHCRSRQAHQTISGGRAAAWITFLPPAGAHLVCRGDQEDADREGQPGAVQY
jgi:hypothetical protein